MCDDSCVILQVLGMRLLCILLVHRPLVQAALAVLADVLMSRR